MAESATPRPADARGETPARANAQLASRQSADSISSDAGPLQFDQLAGQQAASAPFVRGVLFRLHRASGNQAVQRLVHRQLVQRNGTAAASPPTLADLDKLLGQYFPSKDDIVSTIGRLSPADKATVLGGYKTRLAKKLDFSHMLQVVQNLKPTLAVSLEWLDASALMTRAIGYAEIQTLVTSAPAGDKAALKTATWRDWFVKVCTNETMKQAVNDLGFPLETKLEWIDAEALLTRAISYDEVKDLVTAAPAAEKAALNTAKWRDWFVKVCTTKTMKQALNDLGFPLETKLEWTDAEALLTRAISYDEVKDLITAAPAAEKAALKTPKWRGWFVKVCTNETMAEAVNDLGFDLKTKLDWMIEEGTNYALVKAAIGAAAAGDKAAVLGDTTVLRRMLNELSWNDFAKCVELLGRVIPGPGALLADGTVQAALGGAWGASGAAITPAPPAAAPPGVHEEGGFIYMNIVTGAITTDRVAAGAQASLPLNNPNPPDEAVTVGGYHTHPNVGPAWGAPFASGADISWATRNGIPLLIRGAFPTVAATSDTFTGAARAHLAGDRGFPGASGGLAPQALANGAEVEVVDAI